MIIIRRYIPFLLGFCGMDEAFLVRLDSTATLAT